MDDKEFNMPELKENEENANNEFNQNILKEKIEIPKEYYEQKEKQKQERIRAMEEEQNKQQEVKGSGSTFFLILINVVVFFGLLYAMTNINNYVIFAIPAYIVLGTIFSCSAKKKDTKFNVTILVSGMLLALVAFIVGMANKELENMMIYTAFASAITAFVGYVLSTIITKFLTDKENVKALQTIFFLLVIAAIFASPYYLYKKYPEDFIKTVFNRDDVVIANDEASFIISTLNNRYQSKIECDSNVKNYYDSIKKRKVNERTCDIDGHSFVANSMAYNETDLEFIIKDTLLDELYIKDIKKSIAEELGKVVSSNKITVSLYPNEKCYFIGDCENNKNYQKETDLKNLYDYSRSLKVSDYLNMTKEDFFNTYKFRLYIVVKGPYANLDITTLSTFIDKITASLTELGYKNTLGYEIIIEDNEKLDIVYHVKGDANGEQKFNTHQLVND